MLAAAAIAEAWRHDERVYAPVFHSSVNYLAVVRSLYFQRITSELRAMADALEGDAKRPDAGLLLDTYVIVAGIMDEASMHRFLGWPGIADLFLDAIRTWIDALPSGAVALRVASAGALTRALRSTAKLDQRRHPTRLFRGSQ